MTTTIKLTASHTNLYEAVTALTDEYGEFDAITHIRSQNGEDFTTWLTSEHGLFYHDQVVAASGLLDTQVTITEN